MNSRPHASFIRANHTALYSPGCTQHAGRLPQGAPQDGAISKIAFFVATVCGTILTRNRIVT